MALVFEPLPDAEFVLGGAQQARLHLSVLIALKSLSELHVLPMPLFKISLYLTYIVEDEENFALSRGGRSQRSDPTQAGGP